MIKNFINTLQRYRIFRLAIARWSPFIQKSGILKIMQRLNKGSFTDSWGMDDRSDAHKDENWVKYQVDFSRLVHSKKTYTIGFIYKPLERDRIAFVGACESLGVPYVLFDICNPELFFELKNNTYDALLICPSIDNNVIRNLFHETAHLISSQIPVLIYPTLLELDLYEAKRTLAHFLELNHIPHPKTTVFYDYDTAVNYLDKATYPLVFKTHLGASASGVEILKNKKQATRLAGDLFRRYYLRKMESEYRAIEWGYMLIQEYIDEVREFRIIKIGDSWFGYQKWKSEKQEFMSGSGMLKWIDPPPALLDFCYNIALQHQFTTMCYDIFEKANGEYLVNELQTWFGSYDPTEMYVNGIPGRYYKNNDKWIFEPGMYNIHGSIPLRLIDIIQKLDQQN